MRDATYPIIALLRHAKAESLGLDMQDFTRPLSEMGKKQANLVGIDINSKIKQPITVLCSSSLRTQQTFEELHLENIRSIKFVDNLYEGTVKDYIEALANNVQFPTLLIGHNPTILQMVYTLWNKMETDVKFPNQFKTASIAYLSPPKENPHDFIRKSILLEIYRP